MRCSLERARACGSAARRTAKQMCTRRSQRTRGRVAQIDRLLVRDCLLPLQSQAAAGGCGQWRCLHAVAEAGASPKRFGRIYASCAISTSVYRPECTSSKPFFSSLCGGAGAFAVRCSELWQGSAVRLVAKALRPRIAPASPTCAHPCPPGFGCNPAECPIFARQPPLLG